MTDDRLSSNDWLDAGLKALAKSGFTALKADTLAKSLGVSRGSFYWHFPDVAAFHAAILRRWREVALENIIEAVESGPNDRLRALFSRAFQADSRLETAVRAWATADAQAKAVVEAVEAERLRYLQRLLIAAGVEARLASIRARIINWTYLGHALSGRKLDPKTWQQVLEDLLRLATSKA